jgi:uncharacterized phage infection (PIP) family protein YhgE
MEEMMQALQNQDAQLSRQQDTLNQALQRAEQAYEQQSAVLTATRNELSAALITKASSGSFRCFLKSASRALWLSQFAGLSHRRSTLPKGPTHSHGASAAQTQRLYWETSLP